MAIYLTGQKWKWKRINGDRGREKGEIWRDNRGEREEEGGTIAISKGGEFH